MGRARKPSERKAKQSEGKRRKGKRKMKGRRKTMFLFSFLPLFLPSLSLPFSFPFPFFSYLLRLLISSSPLLFLLFFASLPLSLSCFLPPLFLSFSLPLLILRASSLFAYRLRSDIASGDSRKQTPSLRVSQRNNKPKERNE